VEDCLKKSSVLVIVSTKADCNNYSTDITRRFSIVLYFAYSL